MSGTAAAAASPTNTSPADYLDPWNPAWTTDIGTPLGARYQVGAAWRRDYSAGTVIVDPDPVNAQTVSLGATYTTLAGQNVTSITVQPDSAAILTTTTTGSSASAPANTGLPTLSGSAQQGQNLTASTGSWSGSPTAYSYQWKKCDSAGNNCANIAGETFSGISVSSAYVGSTLRATVTASNSSGSGSATSAPSAVVVGTTTTTAAPLVSAPVNTALPTLSGSAQQGQNLTTSTGSWSGSPTGYSYQWKKCDSGGNNCANIGGETFSGITVSSAYVGSTLRATVTASNSSGSGSATSAPSAAVAGTTTTAAPLVSAPVNTALPTLTGTAQQGQNLFTSTGTWSGSPTAYSYQWKLCDSAGNNCSNIAGETFSGITLSSAYVGSTLRATVTASNSSGSGSATSAPSAAVAGTTTAPAAPLVSAPVNTALPTLTGTAQQGQNLFTSTGTWNGSPTAYSYQWKLCDSAGNNCKNIGGEIFSGITLSSAYVGSTLRVTVTASNGSGSASATSAPSAIVAGLSSAPVNTALADAHRHRAAGAEPVHLDRVVERQPDRLQLPVEALRLGRQQLQEHRRRDLQRHHPEQRVCRLHAAYHRHRRQRHRFHQCDLGSLGSRRRAQLRSPQHDAADAHRYRAARAEPVHLDRIWSGSPTAYSYQWKLCDSAGNNCKNIGGEIFSGITLSNAYVGSTLRATVTATNPAGSASATSSPTAVIH